MNFALFDVLHSDMQFDALKVIGKDVEKNGRLYHIIGMTLKEKKATVYVLEQKDNLFEEEYVQERTPRMDLKRSMEKRQNSSFFMHIREFRAWEEGKEATVYEVKSASSGPIKNSDYCEAMMLFLRMREAGWSIPKDSVFYEAGWGSLVLTEIELQGEFETLPDWTKEIQVQVDCIPESAAIEQSVQLECGMALEVPFYLEDGTPVTCYINKVYLMDVWAEEEKHFADPVYRERMLQHVSEEQLEQMKEQLFAALEQHCPRRKHYMVLEYECTEDVSLAFYDKEYLDVIEEPKGGTASAVLMRVKPDEETGTHGLKLRGCVIQKPLDANTKVLEAELFSYSKKIQKSEETL